MTAVTGLDTTASNVFRSRVYPLGTNKLPAHCVFTESETVEYTRLDLTRNVDRRHKMIDDRDILMSVASKLLRALRASPLNLIYVLGMSGHWVMALHVAAMADLSVWIWNQLVKLMQMICLVVILKPPKGGCIALLKRCLPKISSPL